VRSGIAWLATAGLLRSPARSILRVAVLALAAALLGSMLLFIGHSLRTMTSSAVHGVPLDWQGPVPSQQQATRIAARVGTLPGILHASPVATAPFVATAHRSSAGTIRTGRGSVFAVPHGYLASFKTFRLLQGNLRPGQIVLDQQLAATLHARIGDTITLTPTTGTKPRAYRVGGVSLVTAPDTLFQPLDPRLGPAPAQPPAQIAIMPFETFARSYASALRALTPASIGSSVVPGAQDGVQWQVQVHVDPAGLGSSPGTALRHAGQLRNSVEQRLTGQVQFVDNLSDALTTATGDALYAETLFIMLAVPGALVALGLVYLAALGTASRDRRDLTLMRARGSSRRVLVGLATLESLAVALVSGLLGAGLAVAATTVLVQGGVQLSAGRVAAVTLVCVGLAFAGTLTARLGASSGALSGSIAEARRGEERERKPLWQRLYLDFGALAVSGLIYWLTARTGFSAVVNPDSNPTLSLSVYMFFAPALLWIGATLLLVRLRGRAVSWLAALGSGERPTSMRGFLFASARGRSAAINRGLVIVGLLLAFGVNLGLFAATYDQQARADAQLTLGADVVATASAGVVERKGLVKRIGAVSGVASVTPVDHSYAYVGPDLQDTYGIDPATIGRTTKLRDSYFIGGTAAELLARLRSTPDGILVSRETITDYSLRTGDLLKLRVLDRANGSFRLVSFHVVGSVQEFPSAPKDSFMVANLRYLKSAAHDGGPNVVFARTTSDPVAVSARVAAATKADGTAVRNIREQTRQTVSSITTVDLTGIARIESVFVILLAAAAMGLFVGLELAERRHEFATMAALGASLREISAFLWSETVIVLGAALALAAVLGWLLAEMLVAMLRHVFDPPPDALAIPWAFLGLLSAAAIGAAVVASMLAARSIRRLPLAEILREQ
jgi:putative ABC transport system permease protein